MVLDEEELTPLDEEIPLGVGELDEDDCEEVEVEALAADEDAWVVVAGADEAPGMVAALTALKRPTPARAAKAAP